MKTAGFQSDSQHDFLGFCERAQLHFLAHVVNPQQESLYYISFEKWSEARGKRNTTPARDCEQCRFLRQTEGNQILEYEKLTPSYHNT